MRNLFIPGMQTNSKDSQIIKQFFSTKRIKVGSLVSGHRIILNQKKDGIRELLYRTINLER